MLKHLYNSFTIVKTLIPWQFNHAKYLCDIGGVLQLATLLSIASNVTMLEL